MKLRGPNQRSILDATYFIILPLSFFIASALSPKINVLKDHGTSSQMRLNSNKEDPDQSIHFTNASSLQGLSGVIRDLTIAINEPGPVKELLGRKGLTIQLHDVACKSVECSAAVQYSIGDSIYRVKLNKMNRQATDMALATTLIHETMHCVLLDINSRARKQESKAILSVLNFGLNRNDTSEFFNNDFFVLTNLGDPGHHELMYRLLYPQMVSILKRFATLHHITSELKNAEFLAWSGLQNSDAYKNLAEEKKEKIQTLILTAKGITIEDN